MISLATKGVLNNSLATKGVISPSLFQYVLNIIAHASTLSMVLTPQEISRLRLRGVNVLLRFFPSTVELRLRET